mgnify:CR=1 FL=1
MAQRLSPACFPPACFAFGGSTVSIQPHAGERRGCDRAITAGFANPQLRTHRLYTDLHPDRERRRARSHPRLSWGGLLLDHDRRSDRAGAPCPVGGRNPLIAAHGVAHLIAASHQSEYANFSISTPLRADRSDSRVVPSGGKAKMAPRRGYQGTQLLPGGAT